jgi:transposase
MFRKLILCAVLATGTLTALTATAAPADAAPLAFHRRFEVLAERRGCWENRGTFRDRFDAERTAERLRHEGFRVQIREF